MPEREPNAFYRRERQRQGENEKERERRERKEQNPFAFHSILAGLVLTREPNPQHRSPGACMLSLKVKSSKCGGTGIIL